MSTIWLKQLFDETSQTHGVTADLPVVMGPSFGTVSDAILHKRISPRRV